MLKFIVRVAFVATLALGASGCADELAKLKNAYNGLSVAVTSSVVGEVAPRAAIAAIATYDAGVVLATRYQRLKRCDGSNGPLCRDPALRTRIDAAVYSGRSARNDLKAFMRAHPGDATPSSLYDALVSANDAIDSATAAYRAALGQ